ncbi:MAG: signal peptidase I [Gemmatimonadetes bacterium]|nr:signal peptidase I [Gemmatimonadota bacterium]
MTRRQRQQEKEKAESRAAAQTERHEGGGSFARAVWEWTKSAAIALVLFFIIRAFLLEAFKIPTGSMENTLLVGDFLLVNKAVYGAEIPGTGVRLPGYEAPERTDIVVFNPPHDPGKNYVKRLVALPGDTLAMRHKVLYLNGEPQPEPWARSIDPHGDVTHPGMGWQYRYLAPGISNGEYRPTRDNWGPLVVPPGKYFVLGDNRDNSEDSRYWGFIDRSAIKGRPLIIYYSFDPQSLDPFPWIQDIRWRRIGGVIR